MERVLAIDELTNFRNAEVLALKFVNRKIRQFAQSRGALAPGARSAAPSLRSGFRRAAQTRRNRLNLLKKILASTLGAFHKRARPVGKTGRGGCMGRSSLIVRWSSSLLLFTLIAGLTGCSSSSPTKTTNFPTPASISLSPANPVSLDQAQPPRLSPLPRGTARTRPSLLRLRFFPAIPPS